MDHVAEHIALSDFSAADAEQRQSIILNVPTRGFHSEDLAAVGPAISEPGNHAIVFSHQLFNSVMKIREGRLDQPHVTPESIHSFHADSHRSVKFHRLRKTPIG